MSQRSKRRIRRISVLGSSKVCEKDAAYQEAFKLGGALAREGFTVFHGGFRGVMEAVAKGARLSGGHNVGITIQKTSLPGSGFRLGKNKNKRRVLPTINSWADAEIAMPSWHERLLKLIERGDAYIFLDGATGTLTELFVVLEMTNRKLLAKPIIVLGNKLGMLLRMLKKDPHFDLPPQLVFVTSAAKAIRHLRT